MSETRTKARALLAAATPGPWMLNGDASQHGHFGVCAVDDPIADVWGGRENAKGPANATLIAAAPDIIATLIAEADASEQRVDVLRGLADTAAAEQGLAQRRMMEAQEARSAAERRAVEAEAKYGSLATVFDELAAACRDVKDIKYLGMSHASVVRALLTERNAAESERDALRAENKRLTGNIEAAVSAGQRVLDALDADDDMLCEDRADAFQTACEQMIAALSGAVIVEGT